MSRSVQNRMVNQLLVVMTGSLFYMLVFHPDAPFFDQAFLGPVYLVGDIVAVLGPHMATLGLVVFGGLAVGGLVMFLIGYNVNRTHPPNTFDTVGFARREKVGGPGSAMAFECLSCGEEVDAGIRTTFGTRRIIAGVPAKPKVEGTAFDCLDCFVEGQPETARDEGLVDA